MFDIKGGTQPPKSTFIDRPKEGYVRLVQIRDFESDAHPTFVPDKPSLNKCEREDVLIGRYGAAVGRICSGLEGAYNVALVKVLPAEDVDRSYLKHLLRSHFFQDPLLGSSGRSAQAGFNRGDLAAIDLPILPSRDQKAAAAVLDALDDNIELNRRTSATLEEMARALYRSWFVDFDPVHARALGQPPAHMDPTTAALFPDRFGPNGLPKGWAVGTLGDIASNTRRQVQPGDIEAATPYIGLEHMPRRSIALSDWGEAGQVGSAKSAMRRGQILFGKLRPYFHKVGIVPTDGICSTDILVIDAKADCWRELVLSVMSSDDFVEHANATSSGTRMPRSNWKDMARYDIAIPPEAVVEAFSSIVRPMSKKIAASIHEAHTLAALRDALLPRLMSGELRIREAEKQVEEVV
ncbi:restriction endonuclease subunit S [Pelagivirga sediminicola]|uniref:restriction endonuclease subunit S n=1 Tax=Pelagivirga sediminicola TaxID=2170575 RepID=UPI001401DC50